MKQFVTFNPEHRQSAAEILKDPIFDSLRNAEQEVTSTKNVFIPHDEAGAYDYEEFVDNVSLEILQSEIELEVVKLNAFKSQ